MATAAVAAIKTAMIPERLPIRFCPVAIDLRSVTLHPCNKCRQIGRALQSEFCSDSVAMIFDGANRGAENIGDLLGRKIDLQKSAYPQFCWRQRRMLTCQAVDKI